MPLRHLRAFEADGLVLFAAEWGDLEPYFDDAVVFVEWPEAAGDALPPVRVRVRLQHVDESRRLVRVESDEGGSLERLFGSADAGV